MGSVLAGVHPSLHLSDVSHRGVRTEVLSADLWWGGSPAGAGSLDAGLSLVPALHPSPVSSSTSADCFSVPVSVCKIGLMIRLS